MEKQINNQFYCDVCKEIHYGEKRYWLLDSFCCCEKNVNKLDEIYFELCENSFRNPNPNIQTDLNGRWVNLK